MQQERNYGCQFYSDCLTYAAHHGKAKMGCSRCEEYNEHMVFDSGSGNTQRNDLLNSIQATEFLGVKAYRIRKLIKHPNFPKPINYRDGMGFFFALDDLEEFKRVHLKIEIDEGEVMTVEAAKILGITKSAMAHWRRKGVGPSCEKRCGSYWYRRDDILNLKETREFYGVKI